MFLLSATGENQSTTKKKAKPTRNEKVRYVYKQSCNRMIAARSRKWITFLPRDDMLARCMLFVVCLSVRLSVRLSITSRHCTKSA